LYPLYTVGELGRGHGTLLHTSADGDPTSGSLRRFFTCSRGFRPALELFRFQQASFFPPQRESFSPPLSLSLHLVRNWLTFFFDWQTYQIRFPHLCLLCSIVFMTPARGTVIHAWRYPPVSPNVAFTEPSFRVVSVGSSGQNLAVTKTFFSFSDLASCIWANLLPPFAAKRDTEFLQKTLSPLGISSPRPVTRGWRNNSLYSPRTSWVSAQQTLSAPGALQPAHIYFFF